MVGRKEGPIVVSPSKPLPASLPPYSSFCPEGTKVKIPEGGASWTVGGCGEGWRAAGAVGALCAGRWRRPLAVTPAGESVGADMPSSGQTDRTWQDPPPHQDSSPRSGKAPAQQSRNGACSDPHPGGES